MSNYNLFSVYGIELEYMIVHRNTLVVLPIADKLIEAKLGHIDSNVNNGDIVWSNELSGHVIELKTAIPRPSLDGLSEAFEQNVKEINELLKTFDAMLMPTAAHPLMNPLTESKLWQHDYNEVYQLYNRIFNCKGHGWSNVQSTHINLPFANDEEFAKLHTAIRILLPIIPALTASSPILEGSKSSHLDARMMAYSSNQKQLPELMGMLIPEAVTTKNEYETVIFKPIQVAIKPFDSEKIMDKHFLNSRGAIARFDRGAIEIRVLDIQECPQADVAIVAFISSVLKQLANERFATYQDQLNWDTKDLRSLFDDAIKYAEKTPINNPDYLKLFGLQSESATAQDIWKHLFEIVKNELNPEFRNILLLILENGSLSSRILKKIGHDLSRASIKNVYQDLSTCLATNSLFL